MKINVAVFMGGKACEHEISCISAHQVIEAINKEKYNVLPIYIAKNSDLYMGQPLFELKNFANLNELTNKLEKVSLYKDNNKVYVKPIKGMFAKAQVIDVAFPAVHGTNCEDGTLAGYLEMLDLPYTSSNVLGSALGQDKAIMKEVFEYEGIPCVPWFYTYSFNYQDNLKELKAKAKKIGYPLIVKPANLGSSIGIEVIHNEKELEEKLKEASNYDFKLVIEKMVSNLKEVNISVMGNIMDAKVSPIEEVMKNDELLSFKDKYEGGGKGAKGSKAKLPVKASKGMASTNRKVPAELTKSQTKQIEEYALKAYKATNGNGTVRIDFMIDKKTNKVYLNEINTIPGSLAFYLWEAAGISFEKECDLMIENALKMYREKEKKTYSFDTNVLEKYRG